MPPACPSHPATHRCSALPATDLTRAFTTILVAFCFGTMFWRQGDNRQVRVGWGLALLSGTLLSLAALDSCRCAGLTRLFPTLCNLSLPFIALAPAGPR